MGPRESNDWLCDRMMESNVEVVESSRYATPRTSPVVRVADTDTLVSVADVAVMATVGRDPMVLNSLMSPTVVPRRFVAIARAK